MRPDHLTAYLLIALIPVLWVVLMIITADMVAGDVGFGSKRIS